MPQPATDRDYDSRYHRFTEGNVQRLMVGVPIPGITKASFGDRLEAIRRLARQGLSDSQIGQRLGMSARQVLRWRARWQIRGLPVGTNGATRPVMPQAWMRTGDGGTGRRPVQNS